MAKRRAKAKNCKYFKDCGNVWGGCKHPNAVSACLNKYIDECDKSERKYKLKQPK